MKLLTHNMLTCSKKSCTQAGTVNYPLRIKAVAVENSATEFNPQFIIHMLPKLDWKALVQAANDINMAIPAQLPANAAEDQAFLKNLHTVLLDITVKDGELLCPNCHRSYPIKDSVPNLLLNEDEV